MEEEKEVFKRRNGRREEQVLREKSAEGVEMEEGRRS